MTSCTQVHDTRPPGARSDFNDLDSVPKYVMPEAEYEQRNDSVLAWKKAQKLGRFDPDAPSVEQQKIRALEREVEERGMVVQFPAPSPLKTSCFCNAFCSVFFRLGALCAVLSEISYNNCLFAPFQKSLPFNRPVSTTLD